MAKLKQLVRQLNDEDYHQIKSVLLDSNAEKSVVLIETIREQNLSDEEIMVSLGVNASAYYTLRSRLNKKIEEYLLQQMEYPRTDLIRKVSNINEIIFNSKRSVIIATLKKLEKELLDYDMANELTIVYKALKKLHINTPDYFTYSQLYNRQIAYTLAIDKAEDILNEYFVKYGNYLLSGEDSLKLQLSLTRMEMYNVCKLYKSHRLLIYLNLLNIFHKLAVNPKDEKLETELKIDEAFQRTGKIINSYRLDLIYYHLSIVLDFLKALQLETDDSDKAQRKLGNLIKEITPEAPHLLRNFSFYTFPASFLMLKLRLALKNKIHPFLENENQITFSDYKPQETDVSTVVIYSVYRSMSCYYAGQIKEAAQWLYNLLNTVNLKNHQVVLTDIKLAMSILYLLLKDKDLYAQVMSSAERSIRNSGKESQYSSYLAMKMIKTAFRNNKKDKEERVSEIEEEYLSQDIEHFSILRMLLDDPELRAKLKY